MVQRFVFAFILLAGIFSSAATAQTDIPPYASEAKLGELIGQKANVEGVFHKSAFNAPAIAISGRVFYLLENPPSKRTFDLPNESRYASVTGTLYLYDGYIQRNDAYHKVGSRYYFFNIDEAKVVFGEPLKASAGAAANPLSQFIGSWRFDVESTEAEVFKFDDERIRSALSRLIEAFKGLEIVISEEKVSTFVPSLDKRFDQNFEVIKISDSSLNMRMIDPISSEVMDREFTIDQEGRLLMASDEPRAKGFSLYYNRW